MARPIELVKHPEAISIFKRIADATGSGEREREIFLALWSFWNFEHAFDDILDSGKFTPAEVENLLQKAAAFVHEALMTPEAEDAKIWFRVSYVTALNRLEWKEDDFNLAIKALDEFAGNLANNPAYQRHAEQHLAMFDTIIFNTLLGDAMHASGDEFKKALAPALRCRDIDFVVNMAKLVGGWELARKISQSCNYDRQD